MFLVGNSFYVVDLVEVARWLPGGFCALPCILLGVLARAPRRSRGPGLCGRVTEKSGILKDRDNE